jgi:hypothetical protein
MIYDLMMLRLEQQILQLNPYLLGDMVSDKQCAVNVGLSDYRDVKNLDMNVLKDNKQSNS